MKKHFVTFYSPGTFVSETSEEPIDSWDVDTAVEMSTQICERYGARPYGFIFSTRERGPNDLDSKVTKTSNLYYLGGEVLTLAQVRERKDPNDKILISNMEINHWDKIVINTNSYRFTGALEKDDVVIDMSKYRKPKKVRLRS